MVVPIFDGGNLTGMVFTALDLSAPQFTEVIQPLGLGKTGVVEVVDAHGMVLGSTRPELLWRQEDHQGQIASLIENRTTMVGACHSRHTDASSAATRSEDVMAFAPLSAAKWAVELRQSSEEAFTYANAIQQQVLFLERSRS